MAAARAGSGPRLIVFFNVGGVGHGNGFHHLSEIAVAQKHYGSSVFVGEIERENGEISHFLNRRGRKDDEFIIAVAAAFYRLKIVALRRGDVSKAGAAANYVNYEAGNFGAGYI
ncbi:MAG: hypothetical protein ACD_47C00251G0007 [uncultured bacterium]|nr:MAG: hypothetical protein ACD_47C00251G0007 [uncultured bacterium]